jgi:hypothetical protein
VVVTKANPLLPIRVSRFGGRIFVSGGLGRRIGGCLRKPQGRATVLISGIGETPYSALPQVVIHTPLDARVYVAGAAWGAVGRSESLEFSNAGCGDWVIANVRGRMRLSLAGAGGVRAGRAGRAELYSAGAGAIATRSIAGGVTAMSTDSGAIDIGEVDGPFTARVAGSGAIRAAAGRVTRLQATIAGAGDVTLAGTAQSLNASIFGSGDVRVTRVTGSVVKSVIGTGKVRIGA